MNLVTPLLAALSALASAQQATPDQYPDVPYVPTPVEVVEQMLTLAGVHQGDVVYDLGCGDGRIVLMAAQNFGAKATGIDLDADLIRMAREKAKRAGLSEKVTFVQGDLFEADLRSASVVTLYLLPAINQKLKPKLLRDLRPGTRVVSFSFDMGDDWKPDKTADVNGRHVYLWTIPARKP